MKKVTLELEDGQDFRREFISRKSLYQCIRAQNEGSIGVRSVRPYEAFAAAQRLRVMETLARMAVFTVLISGVSLVHARADVRAALSSMCACAASMTKDVAFQLDR